MCFFERFLLSIILTKRFFSTLRSAIASLAFRFPKVRLQSLALAWVSFLHLSLSLFHPQFGPAGNQFWKESNTIQYPKAIRPVGPAPDWHTERSLTDTKSHNGELIVEFVGTRMPAAEAHQFTRSWLTAIKPEPAVLFFMIVCLHSISRV